MSESATDPDSQSPHDVTVIPPVIEADADESDRDEETESLNDSVRNYVHEYGRTYQSFKQQSYYFPNDIQERERMDAEYNTFKMLFKGKINMAPIENPTDILDIGTGPGGWAIDMGEKYPEARVTGTDLAPIQPLEVPQNVYFDLEDCEEDEWGRRTDSFDLIHASMLVGALGSYRKLIKTSYRHLKSEHGWLECWDLDPTIRSDDAPLAADYKIKEWQENLKEASEKKIDPPRSHSYAPRIAGYMRAAGYVDIEEQKYKLPMSSWPNDPFLKEIGRRWGENMLEGLSGFTYKLMGAEGMGWAHHEIEVYLVDVRKAMKDRNVHSYQTLHVVWGRKPSKDEEVVVQKELEKRRKEKQEQRRRAEQQEAPS